MLSVPSFESAVTQAVRNSMKKNFGESTAKALEFYFDSSMVARNPVGYERMLRKTFKAGADHMVKIIEQEIFRVAGAEPREGLSLEQCVEAARTARSKK